MKTTVRIAGALVLTVTAAVVVWLLTGEQVLYVRTSPDASRSYRIEICAPKRYVHLGHRDMQDPGFARLYDNRRNKLIATSDIVDFDGGNAQIMWMADELGEISVGRDIVFRNLRTGP